MSPGMIDDIHAPKSMKNIVQEVMDFVESHRVADEFNVLPDRPSDFNTYDEALHAVWPELFKSDPKAALLVSISIYVDIAERWGFKIQPEEIRELVLK